MTGAVLEWSRAYVMRGFRVVPVPAGEKGSRHRAWENLNLRLADLPNYFGANNNIGVILGPASGELVDADLDCIEALELADLYLSATEAEFGRASKPRSHRLYIAPGAIYETFADPISGKTLIELRAQGRDGGAHQTMFPPSIHPSGEKVEWHGELFAPAVVNAAALRRRMAWLAIGSLTMRYISERAARNPGPDLPSLLWEADHALGRAACRWLGQPAPDEPRRYPRPRHEMSQAELDLAELVAAIPNNCGWDEWNRIGMAIFAASGGSEDGFIIFDGFSSKSAKYDPYRTEARWRNYKRSPPLRLSAGTLFYLAREHGWRPREGAA
jgi:hypothetical protein